MNVDDVRPGDRRALVVGHGRRNGAVGVHDVDRPPPLAQPVGEDVARHLGWATNRDRPPPAGRRRRRAGPRPRSGRSTRSARRPPTARRGGGGGDADGGHPSPGEAGKCPPRAAVATAARRRSAPFGDVTTTKSYEPNWSTAAASAAPASVGSATAMTGTSMGSAPAARRRRLSPEAWRRVRLTITLRPKSGPVLEPAQDRPPPPRPRARSRTATPAAWSAAMVSVDPDRLAAPAGCPTGPRRAGVSIESDRPAMSACRDLRARCGPPP